MTRFSVPEMSCGHCTAAIEKEITAADALAEVACDLATRTVEVDSDLDPAALLAAFRSAGFEAAAT